MKALVYNGSGSPSWETIPDPAIESSTDVIVRVDTTTICGTDLHILKGDVPAVQPGTVLGHEAIGTVVEVGSGVSTLSIGDRVIVSCITSCGACQFCRKQMPSHCQAFGATGWVLGNLINGTQAEYVRLPYGQTSTYRLPEGMFDAQALFLSDIFPTGFEMGVRYGRVQPGDVVAVVGVGPVGLAAVATAGLYGASKVIAIGRTRPRIDKAMVMGATHAVSTMDANWMDTVLNLTDGLGVDVAIEAVGVPETLDQAFRIVRPGGHVANAGVHGKSFSLPINDLWIQNITFTTGLVDTVTIPILIDLIKAGRIHPEVMGTHHFRMDSMLDAYSVFEDASQHNCLKTVITR
ncbi:MAG: alcohol dehydrogenase catalytic domain-containing protein [Bifidobacteriaceae bacterium]|jgi:alcohol dehydrogenase|nr:alcohol dehydrogenase catalytic domain-containing protein [Bifidobacteriaceae bacterium]